MLIGSLIACVRFTSTGRRDKWIDLLPGYDAKCTGVFRLNKRQLRPWQLDSEPHHWMERLFADRTGPFIAHVGHTINESRDSARQVRNKRAREQGRVRSKCVLCMGSFNQVHECTFRKPLSLNKHASFSINLTYRSTAVLHPTYREAEQGKFKSLVDCV